MAQLRVLNPCQENYDGMRGGGATRFCDRCEKSVTNLSEMTRAQAHDFLDAHAGRNVCVRYRVRDGELVFKPSAPVRLAFVAAISLAMAACTGYVDADELDSPEDALLCHDASGYAVPCDEIDEGVIPYEEDVPVSGEQVEPEPEPEPEPVVDVTPPEDHVLGEIAVDEVAEGCPIPKPDDTSWTVQNVDDDAMLMGVVMPSREEIREIERASKRTKRETRQQKRLERQLARRQR